MDGFRETLVALENAAALAQRATTLMPAAASSSGLAACAQCAAFALPFQGPAPACIGVTSGAVPAAAVPAGAYPVGAFPIGAYPTGAVPFGTYPVSAAPAGACPAGAIPQAAIPARAAYGIPVFGAYGAVPPLARLSGLC